MISKSDISQVLNNSWINPSGFCSIHSSKTLLQDSWNFGNISGVIAKPQAALWPPPDIIISLDLFKHSITGKFPKVLAEPIHFVLSLWKIKHGFIYFSAILEANIPAIPAIFPSIVDIITLLSLSTSIFWAISFWIVFLFSFKSLSLFAYFKAE